MQFYYGNKMPLRVLDEADFWKHQEEEHTVVIRELVSNLEKPFVDTLHQWEQVFLQTRGLVIRYLESVIRSGDMISPALQEQIMQLIAYCLEQSSTFVQFCQQMLQESRAIQQNPTAQIVIKHIIRESDYFIGIAQTVLLNS